MLFAAGFLLGRAEAAGTRAAQAAAGAGSGGPVRILAVPGAVRSTGEGEAAAPEEDWALLLVNESHPLPEGFQVKSVWLEEATCYVNLSSALLEGLEDGAVRTALRALESSLRSLDAVEEVRFLVDGEFRRDLGPFEE